MILLLSAVFVETLGKCLQVSCTRLQSYMIGASLPCIWIWIPKSNAPLYTTSSPVSVESWQHWLVPCHTMRIWCFVCDEFQQGLCTRMTLLYLDRESTCDRQIDGQRQSQTSLDRRSANDVGCDIRLSCNQGLRNIVIGSIVVSDILCIIAPCVGVAMRAHCCWWMRMIVDDDCPDICRYAQFDACTVCKNTVCAWNTCSL